jgi:hypothetical protein
MPTVNKTQISHKNSKYNGDNENDISDDISYNESESDNESDNDNESGVSEENDETIMSMQKKMLHTKQHILNVASNINTTCAKNESSNYKSHTQLTELKKSFKMMKEAVLLFGTALTKLEINYHHDIKLAKKHKSKRKGEYKPCGFMTEILLPPPLCKWLHLKEGAKLSGDKISSMVWAELENRNLKDPHDRRLLRVDDETSHVFGVPKSANKCKSITDKGAFSSRTIQNRISFALGREKLQKKTKSVQNKDNDTNSTDSNNKSEEDVCIVPKKVTKNNAKKQK